MDHRVHVAGPPPLRQPVPVITAAPSVEGSARTISVVGNKRQGLFSRPRAVIPEAAKRLSGTFRRSRATQIPDRAARVRDDEAASSSCKRPGHVGGERRPAAHVVCSRRVAVDDAAGEGRGLGDVGDQLRRGLAGGVEDGAREGFERDLVAAEDLDERRGVALVRVGEPERVLGPRRLAHDRAQILG